MTDTQKPIAWIWSPRLDELAKGQQSKAYLEPKAPLFRPEEYRSLFTQDQLDAAVRAERERCAEVADAHYDLLTSKRQTDLNEGRQLAARDKDAMRRACRKLAAAIREGE